VDPSDDDLIASCLAGDWAAFDVLVARYQRIVYQLSYRMVGHVEDAKDIVQEAFLRAYRSLDNFRRGVPFSSWILKITSNLCIDHLRQRHRRPLSLEAGMEQGLELPDTQPSPEESYLLEERHRAVQQAMMELPERYRLPLILRHFHGLSVEEVARTLGQPVGTVKSNLFRAREQLKRSLAAQGYLTASPKENR